MVRPKNSKKTGVFKETDHMRWPYLKTKSDEDIFIKIIIHLTYIS